GGVVRGRGNVAGLVLQLLEDLLEVPGAGEGGVVAEGDLGRGARGEGLRDDGLDEAGGVLEGAGGLPPLDVGAEAGPVDDGLRQVGGELHAGERDEAEARVGELALHGRGGGLEDQLLEALDAAGEGHQSVSSSCSTTRAAGVSRSQASTLSMTP